MKTVGKNSSNNLDKKLSPINYNRLGSINGSNNIGSTTVFGTNSDTYSGTNNNK